jgi:hypothetical protein
MREHKLQENERTQDYSIAYQITKLYDRFFNSGRRTLKMRRKISAVLWKTVIQKLVKLS